MTDIQALISKVGARHHTVRLGAETVTTELLRVREQLQTEKRRGDESLRSKVPGLERRLAELEAELDATAVEFTFQAIPRARLEAIKAAHPPSEAQWAAFRAKIDVVEPVVAAIMEPPTFDLEAAAPEIIAASAVDPTLTVDEAKALFDGLSDGQAAALIEGAWEVQRAVSRRPFSATATAEIPSGDAESTSAASPVSLSHGTKAAQK